MSHPNTHNKHSLLVENNPLTEADSFTAEFISSIDHIDAQQWNYLCGSDYPFLRHEFFAAMEHSGSTTQRTGWQPHHLIIKRNQQPCLVMPWFLKYHSNGEYMFDWAWADAYQRNGLDYYPKLLNAIPFTPATGPRWGASEALNDELAATLISSAIENEAARLKLSSCHCLFPNTSQQHALVQQKWLHRTGYQYHWFNDNYTDFDAFLAKMTSRKRKNLIKERRKIQEQGITICVKNGEDITKKDWDYFYQFYQATYLKRSGQQGYLSPSFFPLLAEGMCDTLVMVLAYHTNPDEPVAAALCFKDSQTLYGRYWGCKENFDSLHFEACYYQGIEYAIEHGIKRFDPGAQGEHKIQRGFTPIKTLSSHWIAHEDFRSALEDFVEHEEKEVDTYLSEASQHLPFKQADK